MAGGATRVVVDLGTPTYQQIWMLFPSHMFCAGYHSCLQHGTGPNNHAFTCLQQRTLIERCVGSRDSAGLVTVSDSR